VPLSDVDPRYVAARRILLNALVALAPQQRAVIVVGAQAIYLRTGSGDLSVAPYTTDGDLALDPSHLSDDPELEATMEGAGFHLLPNEGGVEPGIWVASARVGEQDILVPVDLIVPEGVAGAGGRRGARLGVHGNRAARRAVGLEAALVDHSAITVSALEEGDSRCLVAEVAGSAALLVAKAHKVHDRVGAGRKERMDDKDAADVVRLMQAIPARLVRSTLDQLRQDPIAGSVTTAAVSYLAELFGRRGRPGIEMAARALRLALPLQQVEALCVAYVSALVAEDSGVG
jgi:hypothetical protein